MFLTKCPCPPNLGNETLQKKKRFLLKTKCKRAINDASTCVHICRKFMVITSFSRIYGHLKVTHYIASNQ